ncbi:MAG: hypothetical protein AAGA63_05955 [Pseudomonadota bacterium]
MAYNIRAWACAVLLAVIGWPAVSDDASVTICITPHPSPTELETSLSLENWSVRPLDQLAEAEIIALTLAYMSTYHYGDATTAYLDQTFALSRRGVEALKNKPPLDSVQTRIFSRTRGETVETLQYTWITDGTNQTLTCRISTNTSVDSGERPFSLLQSERFRSRTSNTLSQSSVSQFALSTRLFASLTRTPVTITLVSETWQRWMERKL